ncbi:ATP-dependent zinc metalloprotease FtsH [Egibacter rhizosphaerae]|uniref:ATP-dependent zinc metalloprotease FtsH n=1 Tax=Egibacter rhizosphaerae TaxID=1670831 RepID=UPI0013F16AE7|nr:ATP-dependent zinc metalloprotease FtsH [Egibacter rhizosphaerae]
MDRNTRIRLLVAVSLIAILLIAFATLQPDDRITYQEFVDEVESGEVESATFTGQSVEGEFVDEERGTFSTVVPPELVVGRDGIEDFLVENDVELDAEVETDGGFTLLLFFLFPLLLFVLFFWYLNRQAKGQMGGLGNVGKSKAKVHKPHEPTTRFSDVAGYKEVKQEIEETVAFLREPERFRAAGANIPKGMLMVGPPGTGKTLLAKAVAGEAGVPFISVTGSDFMEMFVGVGASRVRDMFKTAREHAPCIIFIDELDSIGRKRGAGLGGGHDEREQTLNQMLGEIDGFEGSEGVVIMGATNRPDVLDPALLRPGRFDRQVTIPLPTLEERIEILDVHLKGKPIDDTVDREVIARGTPGMAGADLQNLINEAALIAVRNDSEVIRMSDIEAARERQTIGRERSSVRLDEQEKRAVAYHEGGHALAAFIEEEADPVYKLTCLPTGMALGVTEQLPIDERHIYLRSYLDARLKVMLGGRAAELVVLGQPTTGGQHDLVQATRLARAIVREYGMSDAVGPVGYGDQQQVFLGEELARGSEHSEKTAEAIDAEVTRILRTSLDEVVEKFRQLRGGLDEMAAELVERETLSGEEALEAVRRGVSEELAEELLRGSAVPGSTWEAMGGSRNGQGPDDDERSDDREERAGMA